MANKSKDVEKRPVGKNDNPVYVAAININQIIEYDEVSKRDKDVLEVTNTERVGTILSSELGQKELSIKAKDMDKNTLIYFEQMKQALQDRKAKQLVDNNMLVFSEEKQKRKDDGRNIG